MYSTLPTAPILRTFVQYLIAYGDRLETASDVISGRFVGPIVPDKSVKFGDPRSNCSRYILAAHLVMDERLNDDDERHRATGSVVIGQNALALCQKITYLGQYNNNNNVLLDART